MNRAGRETKASDVASGLRDEIRATRTVAIGRFSTAETTDPVEVGLTPSHDAEWMSGVSSPGCTGAGSVDRMCARGPWAASVSRAHTCPSRAAIATTSTIRHMSGRPDLRGRMSRGYRPPGDASIGCLSMCRLSDCPADSRTTRIEPHQRALPITSCIRSGTSGTCFALKSG
jgi:hypothetical protein